MSAATAFEALTNVQRIVGAEFAKGPGAIDIDEPTEAQREAYAIVGRWLVKPVSDT
jgi:hypothetical protein